MVASGTAATAGPRPDVIPLPDGFQPEGIASGTGNTVYAGSLGAGDIVRADLRTGAVDTVVDAPDDDRITVGLKYSKRTKQLFAAGGPSGQAYVYDARTGMEAGALMLVAPGTGFVNDVALTKDGAWFTESFQVPQLFFVPVSPDGSIGTPQTLTLSGPVVEDYLPGEFNLNGIAATRDGSRLIVVNSTAGTLYTVDPSTGESQLIDLGGDDVDSGDGILLDGRRLWVVQNFLNQVAEVRLASDFSGGTVVSVRTDSDFDVPTTVARKGNSLAVVNARFTTPPTPETEYDIAVLDR